MISRKTSALATVCMLTLSACGGGGSGGGGGSVPPPVAAKTINASNYIDAVWGVGIGLTRLELLSLGASTLFRTVMTAGDNSVAGYPCPNGGSFNFVKSGNSRAISFTNASVPCVLTVDTITVQFASGTVTVPDGVLGTLPGSLVVFNSGTFNFSSLGFNWGVGVETANGSVVQTRRADGSVSATGTLTVTRNGRDDRYSNIVYATATPDVNGNTPIASATYAVASPRVPFTFNATAADNFVRAVAADNSAAQGTFDATGQNLTYTVYNNFAPGAAADLTQTLNSSDPLVQAAIQRLLQ
jgi:hypothetical protein